MEEFITKGLLQSGLGFGGVLVIIYVLRELQRLQKFVEDELAALHVVVTGQGEKIGVLDKNDAVLEERIKNKRAGEPMRRHDD